MHGRGSLVSEHDDAWKQDERIHPYVNGHGSAVIDWDVDGHESGCVL